MLSSRDLVLCSPPVAHIPVTKRLSTAREAGFAGISLLPADLWDYEAAGGTASGLAARIADEGLAVAEMDCIANWLPGHCGTAGPFADALLPLTPARVIDAAQRLGARSVAVAEIAGVDAAPDQAAEAFAGICDMAAEHGLIVHLEFLPFGSIRNLASALAIVEAAGRPNGALTIDSWHFFRSGSSLADLARVPGARIGSVQLSDAPAEPADDVLDEAIGGRLPPGRGALDLAALVRTLDRIGNAAPIGVELFSRSDATLPIDDFCTLCGDSARDVLAVARGDR